MVKLRSAEPKCTVSYVPVLAHTLSNKSKLSQGAHLNFEEIKKKQPDRNESPYN